MGKGARLGSSSPFSSVCLCSEPRVEKGVCAVSGFGCDFQGSKSWNCVQERGECTAGTKLAHSTRKQGGHKAPRSDEGRRPYRTWLERQEGRSSTRVMEDDVGVHQVVSGTLLEVSLQEGPCLEDWQGALGAGWEWRGQGRIGNIRTLGVEVIQQFNREEIKAWLVLGGAGWGDL